MAGLVGGIVSRFELSIEKFCLSDNDYLYQQKLM